LLTYIGHEDRIPGNVTLADHLKQSPNRCFVVAFVRNPFDRLVSAFYYLNRGGIRIPLIGACRRDKRDAAKYIFQYQGDFRSFVRGTMNGSRPNVFEQIHLRPQIEWMVDESGNLLVDFLGKFEHLEADISELAQVLCIPMGKMPLRRRTQHPPYRSLYDCVTSALVSDAYRQDFERFGYNPGEFS
jgi:chondroitin 4-sulfotransferase 11